jgi:conjugative relaxase-like TrwC/TraI family protein
MLTIRAMSNGEGYSARHLEHSDYYAEDERVIGEWHGRGAQMLGLSGEVRSDQFEAVRQGIDPTSGEFLRQRQSADRIAADGTTQSHGRNLYDFTISAPKSVSLMARLGGDERLLEAHQAAVEEALVELEAHAGTRVRQNGANDDRTTGNLVIAVYHHDTSRELDPQLHTHAVAANMTYDGIEGRWKALQASDIYERRAYLSEVYRNALARRVTDLGYQIDNRRDDKGQDAGFEIRGISDRLLEDYSQRSRQRDAAIERFAKVNGRQPTDNEIAVLVRESRADKLLEISTAEVKERQLARLSPEDSQILHEIREQAINTHPREMGIRESAFPSLNYATEHIFERVSVARDYELLSEALRHGRGQIDLGEVKGALRLEESSGRVFRAGHEIATRDSLERERQMINSINQGIGRFDRLGGDSELVVSDRLRPEQKHVVEFVLASRDRAVNIRGAAGTGKTATLQELRRGLNEGGREVLAVAPTMSAVEELQKVGFSDAITIQRLVQDERAQAEVAGKVLIVDEAGMVSGRQMGELLEIVERQSARIVFSGDTRQIQSVEASDALRILEKESHLKSTSLTQVQRQAAQDYREAIQELRRNPDRGFDKLEQIGAVREVAGQERARTVAEVWSDARSQPNGKGGNREVLVVCATHAEIGSVTEAIRLERKQNGELGESFQAERYVPQNYTTAQKSDPRNLHPGQMLLFHRATKDVNKNEALEVIRIEKHKIIARNEVGAERELSSKQAKCFEVYERRTVEVAPNDKLLLTANRRDRGFRATNGETVTVSHVDEQGRIRLEDGRTLPGNYKHFDHGYAVTAHRSQGKSVDAVVISGDAMKKELFYVAASRGRESVTVVTSDKELLRESVGRSGERQSASELVRKTVKNGAPGQWFGKGQQPRRGLSVAREMARKAAQQQQDSITSVPVGKQEAPRESPTHDRGLDRGQDYDFGR